MIILDITRLTVLLISVDNDPKGCIWIEPEVYYPFGDCREGQISQVFDCLMADQKVTYSTENSKNRPVTCTIRIVSYLQLSKSVAFINLFYQNTPVIYSQIVQYVFHPQTNDVLVPILVS